MSDKPKSVLITGGSGLLGRSLMRIFGESPLFDKVVGTAFSRTGENLVKLDLCDFEALTSLIDDLKPDWVIHAAAQRFPDKVEKDPAAAQRLNVDATRTLCNVTNRNGGRVLYISTDYVFDGAKPPFKLDDPPNPLNAYGKLKLDGEKVALEESEKNLVLRIPVLYGQVQFLEESAVTVLLKTLMVGNEGVVNDYEIRRPSHVDDISGVALGLVEKSLKEPQSVDGVFQWCGEEAMTKYSMVKTMAETFGLDIDGVKADSAKPQGGTPRPYDTTMDTSRLKNLGIGRHTEFATGIKEVLVSWVDKK